MKQEAMRKFKVIGSCVGVQTSSLDEVIELLNGVLYEINFDQDFSSICLNGQPITDLSAGAIIGLLNIVDSKIAADKIDTTGSSSGEYRSRREFRERFDKFERNREKQEERWKKYKKSAEYRRGIEKTKKRILKGL